MEDNKPDFTYFNDEIEDEHDIFRYCVKTICKLKRLKYFYVGATNMPEQKLIEEITNKEMKKMYVLTKINNKESCNLLYDKLIKRFAIHKNMNTYYNNVDKDDILYDGTYIYVLFCK